MQQHIQCGTLDVPIENVQEVNSELVLHLAVSLLGLRLPVHHATPSWHVLNCLPLSQQGYCDSQEILSLFCSTSVVFPMTVSTRCLLYVSALDICLTCLP